MSKNNVFISFITPAYNVNKYLDDYFKSFIGLDKSRYEIIFVDDKSPEDTSSFITKYDSELNIKYIKNKINTGKGFARNNGLAKTSAKSTHVVYIDSDDMMNDLSFIDDVEKGKITWFNNTSFTTKKVFKEDKIKSFGKNLFTNTIWGVAIPTSIAKQYPFESNYYEDMFINRAIIANHKDIINLNQKEIIAYRHRKSGATSAPTSVEKFKEFIVEMMKIENIGSNTTRFNMQEIYQYFWMWKKHLKGLTVNELPDTKLIYKILFFLSGNAIRFLKLENLVYGRKRNAFE